MFSSCKPIVYSLLFERVKNALSFVLIVTRIRNIFCIFAPCMEKIRINVVGLYHWDVRTHPQEYVAEAVGKQLVLQPQHENVKDPYAVKVREGSKHIGYVAVPDLDVVYQAMKGSGMQRLRGVVVDSNIDPPVLTIEIEVEKIDWDYEPFDDTVYQGWHYDGLPLIAKIMEQQAELADDLMYELENPSQGQGNVTSLAKKLLLEQLFDPSREMTRTRYRLERKLSESNEPEWQKCAQKLRKQKGLLMRHDDRDEIARKLFIDLPRQLRKQGLEDSHYTYDNRLDELEQQLRAFPFQMYDKFLSDPVDFLREVYYKHVPRKYLLQLLSGIVLMILKGRVRIQRWGREGDNKPIEQIENLSKPLNNDDRLKAMKEGLKQLLLKKCASGEPFINQKSQWAAIISVLSFDYHVESADLKDMCSKMADWGFGKDSGYEYYCSYDSVVKCNDYACKPFNEWRGQGTAHKRQVTAATELRAILRPKIGYK